MKIPHGMALALALAAAFGAAAPAAAQVAPPPLPPGAAQVRVEGGLHQEERKRHVRAHHHKFQHKKDYTRDDSVHGHESERDRKDDEGPGKGKGKDKDQDKDGKGPNGKNRDDRQGGKK